MVSSVSSGVSSPWDKRVNVPAKIQASSRGSTQDPPPSFLSRSPTVASHKQQRTTHGDSSTSGKRTSHTGGQTLPSFSGGDGGASESISNATIDGRHGSTTVSLRANIPHSPTENSNISPTSARSGIGGLTNRIKVRTMEVLSPRSAKSPGRLGKEGENTADSVRDSAHDKRRREEDDDVDSDAPAQELDDSLVGGSPAREPRKRLAAVAAAAVKGKHKRSQQSESITQSPLSMLDSLMRLEKQEKKAKAAADAAAAQAEAARREKEAREVAAAERAWYERRQQQGMHCLTDEELGERYGFEKEIGSGNWGSCWKAVITHSLPGLPVVKDASGKPQRRTVAVKLVVRDHSSASKSRVKALWNEFKVMRSACSFEEMHPNLVVFREFLFSPSYACLTMDFFDQAMQVCLSRWVYAGPDGFFQQLTSAVAWLHARNITHCDIKVQNMMVHPGPDGRERPILLDFGFAKNHDPNSGFITNARWGTPEYLSPERARGDDHDERLADVWALGVSLYEIAVGRTPFENVNETFLDTESLTLYYERTVMSAWQGNWDMISVHCESLVRAMVEPDTKKRIQAKDALNHPFFWPENAPGAQRRDKHHNGGRTSDLDDSLIELLRVSERVRQAGDRKSNAKNASSKQQDKQPPATAGMSNVLSEHEDSEKMHQSMAAVEELNDIAATPPPNSEAHDRSSQSSDSTALEQLMTRNSAAPSLLNLTPLDSGVVVVPNSLTSWPASTTTFAIENSEHHRTPWLNQRNGDRSREPCRPPTTPRILVPDETPAEDEQPSLSTLDMSSTASELSDERSVQSLQVSEGAWGDSTYDVPTGESTSYSHTIQGSPFLSSVDPAANLPPATAKNFEPSRTLDVPSSSAGQGGKGARPFSAAITQRDLVSLKTDSQSGQHFRCALLSFDHAKPGTKQFQSAWAGEVAATKPSEAAHPRQVSSSVDHHSSRGLLVNSAMGRSSDDRRDRECAPGNSAVGLKNRPCPTRQCSEESSMCSVVTAQAGRPSLSLCHLGNAIGDHANDVEMISDVTHSTHLQSYATKPPPPPRPATMSLEKINEGYTSAELSMEIEQMADGVGPSAGEEGGSLARVRASLAEIGQMAQRLSRLVEESTASLSSISAHSSSAAYASSAQVIAAANEMVRSVSQSNLQLAAAVPNLAALASHSAAKDYSPLTNGTNEPLASTGSTAPLGPSIDEAQSLGLTLSRTQHPNTTASTINRDLAPHTTDPKADALKARHSLCLVGASAAQGSVGSPALPPAPDSRFSTSFERPDEHHNGGKRASKFGRLTSLLSPVQVEVRATTTSAQRQRRLSKQISRPPSASRTADFMTSPSFRGSHGGLRSATGSLRRKDAHNESLADEKQNSSAVPNRPSLLRMASAGRLPRLSSRTPSTPASAAPLTPKAPHTGPGALGVSSRDDFRSRQMREDPGTPAPSGKSLWKRLRDVGMARAVAPRT